MLKISKWWDQFETAGSRKLVNTRYFSSTAGNDSRGYRKLMRMGIHGVTALGTFHALCQLMATLGTDARKQGALINSDGSYIEIDDLSELTRIPVEVLEHNLARLETIGWVDRLEPLEVKESPTNLPSSATSPPPIPHRPPSVEYSRVGESRVGEGLLVSDETSEILKELWINTPKMGRERTSKKKVAEQWKKTKSKPSRQILIEAIKAWSKCREWTRDGGQAVQGLHIWIKDERWESLPEPATNNSTPALQWSKEL